MDKLRGPKKIAFVALAAGGEFVNMRHGVSRLRSGHRHTVGVIFHDAK